MKTNFERLAEARAAAGYVYASDAARAMGVRVETYVHHENGTRGLSRVAERYARFFRVSLEWLMTGKGDMRPKRQFPALKLMGQVGAGTTANRIDEDAWAGAIDSIDLPTANDTFVLQVVGDSALPRYHSGDYLMVNRRSYLPDEMINRYCVLDLADGRRVVKLLERVNGVFVLRSQNPDSALEIAPKILGCYRIVGVLLTD
jgi:SOS-response transcriptional repressor LexA